MVLGKVGGLQICIDSVVHTLEDTAFGDLSSVMISKQVRYKIKKETLIMIMVLLLHKDNSQLAKTEKHLLTDVVALSVQHFEIDKLHPSSKLSWQPRY